MKPSANLPASRYDFAFDTISSLVPRLPSRVVLDIGAGAGEMRKIETLGVIWRGFDQVPGIDMAAWDLTERCPDRGLKAGAAILLDVLEHCLNPGLALRHVAEVLQPDARLVLTMPNPRWSRSRFSAVYSGYPTCFTPSDLELNHHVFTPWPHIVKKMLDDVRFELEDYVTLDGKTKFLSGAKISPSYPLRCVFNAVLMAVEEMDPSACGMSYGFVARKR